MNSAVQLRRELHRYPDLSGHEQSTAQRISQHIATLKPDTILSGLGGAGVAFGFGGMAPGPTILLRCELDALPIQESNEFAWRSTKEGVSHKCGHDGHMAILVTVAETLARARPQRGRVVLLFQPAEETGVGAKNVVADPGFVDIQHDLVFGLHNIPGIPLGEVVVRNGTFSCASRGMSVRLRGKPAHAAQPETGRSPTLALARILDSYTGLPAGLAESGELMFATVVGARMGGANFGIAPADAEVFVTLRAETDASMERLVSYCESQVRAEAERAGLELAIDYQDVFDATINSPVAVDIIRRACSDMAVTEADTAFRWSEDFGRFTQVGDGAFFGLGAGIATPDLHNEDYDFPDALIEKGAAVFLRIIDESMRTLLHA